MGGIYLEVNIGPMYSIRRVSRADNDEVGGGGLAGFGDGGFQGGEAVAFGEVEGDDIQIVHRFREGKRAVLLGERGVLRRGKRDGTQKVAAFERFKTKRAAIANVRTVYVMFHVWLPIMPEFKVIQSVKFAYFK